MYKTGFLILNYNTAEMTQKCIQKLKQLKHYSDILIFIVDNSDNAIEICRIKEICDDNKIFLFRQEANKGFSAGNNYGYREILNGNYELDFLVCMNSDVFIEQNDFLDKLYMQQNEFYVAGPDIYIPKIDYHSNPFRNSFLVGHNLDEERKQNTRISIKEYMLYWGIEMGVYELYKKSIWKIKNGITRNSINSECNDIVLQGACLIFSKEYMKKNERLFTPETFMYYEEDILAIRCKRNDWKMVYLPELQVLHLAEGSSTCTLTKLGVKLKMKKERKRASLRVYENYLENGEI